jgi:RNA polymerase sigma-70 factor (ECF subfamily)
VPDTGNDNLDDIIRGCIRKREKSQEMLYKKFFGYAMKMALLHSRNRENALEVVNDSFVKVFSSIGRYDFSLPFKNWLGRIVINTSIDRFRKNRMELVLEDEATILIPDSDPGIINKLTAEEIIKLLHCLPEVQRMVFSLHEIEGYNHDEISTMLRIPESTSRVYLTRAKKRLRELFEKYFSITYGKLGN